MADKLKVSVNMDDLTFGELEEFENVTGMVMSDAVREEVVRDSDGRPVPDPDDPRGRPLKVVKMSAKAMVGMVYLALHKDDETVTIESVRKLRLSDVDFDMQEPDSAASADDENPTLPEEQDFTPNA